MDLPLRASARRLLLLSLLAAVVGGLAGLAAYVLIHLIALLTNLALFGTVNWLGGWYDREEPLSPDGVRDALVRQLLHGVSAGGNDAEAGAG